MAIAVVAAMIAVGLTAAAAAPLMGGHCCCLLVGPLFHITIAERESCMPCSLYYYEGNAVSVHAEEL
jgi:hypothetical protein